MRIHDKANSTVWLAAHFHMSSLYTCKSPISSHVTGVALPTPGPATIQQAMIRVGIETFGIEHVKDKLFQHIIASHPLVRPPESIAISEQKLKLFKADDQGNIVDGFGYRQMVHAEGDMVIYVKTDVGVESDFTSLLRNIGYWGQTSSFAYCTKLHRQEPQPGCYAQPVEDASDVMRIGAYYTAYVTELHGGIATWEKIVDSRVDGRSHLGLRLYVWPLTVSEHRSSGQLLRFRSLVHSQMKGLKMQT